MREITSSHRKSQDTLNEIQNPNHHCKTEIPFPLTVHILQTANILTPRNIYVVAVNLCVQQATDTSQHQQQQIQRLQQLETYLARAAPAEASVLMSVKNRRPHI